MKENTENTRREVDETNDEISQSQPYCPDIGGGETIEMKYSMVMTMLDTKVINALNKAIKSTLLHLWWSSITDE